MTIRIFNILFVLLLSIILSPIFILTALAIKITSKGPALHWSKRVGKDNAIFLMPKFRTMTLEVPQVATHLLQDSKSYLTPVGSFLRKTSLDEIPQLWSILIGQMSLVGPRPALFNQDDLVELRTRNGIHKLLPGVTGWAQINGRDELSIPDKVKFEVEYLQRRSFLFDLQIIFLTAIKVILRKDVSH